MLSIKSSVYLSFLFFSCSEILSISAIANPKSEKIKIVENQSNQSILKRLTFNDNEPVIGMIGKFPKKINQIIKQFKRNDIKETDNILRNRALLYGPPGNGKSTIVQTIAKETGAELFTLKAPNLITPYIGSGPDKIDKTFTQAAELLEDDEKAKVIIFIDEIDAIAAYTNKDSRTDHKACVQALWLQLDTYKDNPRMFFFFATNNFRHLDKTFLDRFASNVIEIKNPDYYMRCELLANFFHRANIAADINLISSLALRTSGLSARALEDFVNDIRANVNGKQLDSTVIWTILGQIKSKNGFNVLKDPMESLKQAGSAALNILRIYELIKVFRSMFPHKL